MFDFCNQFLQTRDELTSATADLLGRLADRNVWYAEVRFCPSLHTLEGMTEDQAVQAVIDGVRAKSEVIAAGVILCALRSKGAEHGVAVARLAKKHLQVPTRSIGHCWSASIHINYDMTKLFVSVSSVLQVSSILRHSTIHSEIRNI